MRPNTLFPTALLLLINPTTATFSLNTTGPYWSYTAQQLTASTHEKCRTAYSAPIACTETLLGLVTSLRPGFQPTEDDLSRMCTLSCKSALEDYVQNLGSQCGLKGDLATQQAITTGRNDTYERVWIVGQMFEYTYAQSCAKDQNNNFCPLTSTTLPSSPANCSSPCSVSFYTNAHDFYPASHKQFRKSYLTTQSQYWIKQFVQGYQALVACGEAVPDSQQTNSASGGFAQPKGMAAANRTGKWTGNTAAAATVATSSSLTGTTVSSAPAETSSTSTVSPTPSTQPTATVVQSGKNAGSVLETDLKKMIGLGVLGLVSAAVLL